jgi:hypothetical protein
MDRRSANQFALTAMALAFASFPMAWASTHCSPDGLLTIDGKVVTMSSVVSSASTRATIESVVESATTNKVEKNAKTATTPASIAQTAPSNPATAGGGVAGGGDEGGIGDSLTPSGAHRRGARWQSFLPGVIR